MRKNIHLGKLLGIEVALDYSWTVLFALVAWSLYVDVYSTGASALRISLALATTLLFSTSILAHEFGHSLVASALGVPVRRITLFIFGGLAQLTREPRRFLDEFLIALAGPLVSLTLAGGFGLLWLSGRWLDINSLTTLARWLGLVNLSLGLFNLIPGFPLDGGRVLRAIVWGMTGDLVRATRLVAKVGQGVGWLFVTVGMWQILIDSGGHGIWLALIGWFLYNAAATYGQQATQQSLLRGHTVRELMVTNYPHVIPQLSLQQLQRLTGLRPNIRHFPVVKGAQLVGVVSVQQLEQVPPAARVTTPVREVMTPLEQLSTARPDEELNEILQRMVAKEVKQLPVLEGGEMVGMVSLEQIARAVQRLGTLSST